MRKLMIAMLALAVVFGFAACDNNSGSASLTDQYVVSLEVTSGPEAYFDGQTVDVADYTVTATRVDGSTFTVPSEDLEFFYSSGSDLTENEDSTSKVIGSISYTGFYKVPGTVLSVAVEADVYTADAINVEGPAVAQLFNTQGVDDFDYSVYTVTAYALDDDSAVLYSDEIEVTDDNVTEIFTFTDALNTDVFKTGNWDIPVKFGSATKAISGGKNTVTISVKLDTLKGISLKVNEDKEAIIGTAKAGKAGDFVTVVYTMESGKTYEGDDYQGTKATVDWTSSTPVNFASAAEEITAKITINGSETTAKASITPVADYITKFKVSSSAWTGSTGAVTVSAGTKLDTSTMTVSLEWASVTGPTDAPEEAELTNALKIVVGGTTEQTTFDTTNYAANDKLPISFSLTGLGNIVTDKTECAITSVSIAAV